MQLLREASNGAPVSSSPDACARAMLDGMPQVMWFIRRQMRQHRTRGMSVPQFRTLVLLDRYPTASLSVVAENLGATLPTASRMVSGLVTKGFVARKAHPTDRRQASLVLTAKGRSALNTARQATQDGMAREIARLSGAERAMITRAMGLLQEAFAGTPLPGADGGGEAGGADEAD
jgi:DNA-binding MarR family transcriptional regulator